ncbi:MAG: CPBP family intramembrane metalloprotease [Clostridiales bacterium]|nr:CPBP family intramembrane metalloprotease [Clostridiales bacterium]
MRWNARKGYDLLIIFLLQLIAPAIGVLLWLAMGGTPDHLEAYAFILSPPLSLLVLLSVLTVRRRMGEVKDLFRPVPSGKELLLWGGGGALLAALAGEGSAYLLSFWIPLQENNPLVTDSEAFTRPLLVALFVSAGLLAPIGEELYYRGLLLDFLRPLGTWGAAFLSSLLFGLAHGLLTLLIPLFLVGLVLALLRVYQGTLWPSVMAHSLFNLASLTLALVGG